MPARRPLHKVAHATCPLPNWAACDKVRDETYADWQAMQQVLLAYNIVVGDRWKAYRKDKGAFAQLVQFLAGERQDIMNDDGNASQAAWVLRLRAAIERVKAGDLPGYNLYTPASPAEQEST